jgi:hypothetical protein
MLDDTTMIRPADATLATADEEANSWRIALLLVAQHGARAVEVGLDRAAAASGLERDLWPGVVAAAEELLDALSPTDLLYATALAPTSKVGASREAA